MQELCKVEECNQPIASRKTKLCHKHHYRQLRYGSIELHRKLVDKSKKCTIKDCDRNQQTLKGYCLKHYKAWKRTQPKDKTKKCSVCDNLVGNGSRGMCVKHYQQFRRNGDSLAFECRKYEPYGNGKKYYKDEDGQWTHRRVAEKKLGRKLEKGEVVHHINLNKLDNNPSNLIILSNSAHLSLHRQLESIAGQLVRDGLIEYRNGKYCRNI